MDKRTALKILVNNSLLLDDNTRAVIHRKLPEFTDDEVEKWGLFFALEKKTELENRDAMIAETQKIIQELERKEQKSSSSQQ